MNQRQWRVPFNQACLVGTEEGYIAEAVRIGHISGDGPFTKRCEAWLAERLGAARVLLTTSCTHALEMAALLLDVGPGDEVVVPSFTFVSTANAFALRGARPVFADIRPDTLNIDADSAAAVCGPRTRALVPVHYGGVGCDMNDLLDLAETHQCTIVEDNAHGLLGRYRDKPLGSFGRLATQSFHETKNFTCGEGGALVINDETLIARAEIMREKGTNRSQFFRGEVDKYTWVDIGSSYVASDVLAAILYAQLEAADSIQAHRQRVWERYDRDLAGWCADHGVRQPVVPAECDQSYHLYYLLLPSLADRTRLIDHLRQRDILSVFHYQPLHTSPMGERFGARRGQCPVTEDVADRLVRLPFFNDLTAAHQDEVIDGILSLPM
jgi:dTDP-4-amino-4,6-dideoxygalactose transaminase